MISPEDRKIYTEALCPPPGFVFDHALATTYTLDLTTLLSIPLSLALAEASRPDDILEDGVALLEALKRTAGRMSVYCDTGRISVPTATAPLFGLLEKVLLQADAPRGGAFHPKLWVVRYVRGDRDDKALLRLLVLSRNLTADRSWDLSLLLEGTPDRRYYAVNREFGEFIAGLPKMCGASPDEGHRDRAQSLADEIRRTNWQLPPGYNEYKFHVIGHKPRQSKGWLPPWSNRMVVISPFLPGPALKSLASKSADRMALISRWEEFDRLTEEDRGRFKRCLALHEAAASEDGQEPAPDDIALRGLHAKAYVFEKGWNTHVVVGSANATSAALLAGNNVELLVELVGRRRVGRAKDIFDSEAMRGLLVDYVPHEDQPKLDEDGKAEEDLLNTTRKALGAAPLRVLCIAAGEGLWRLLLAGAAVPKMENLRSVKAWPVTLHPNAAVTCWEASDQAETRLAEVQVHAVTGLIAFELVAPSGEQRIRFVLNLPVEGMPDHRDAAIVAHVVSSEQKFLRYLRMLLGGLNDGQGHDGGLLGRLSRALSRSGTGSFEEIPLLEELTRTFSRHPERLDSVARLVDELRSSPETCKVIPDRFLRLWEVFEEAREGTK